MTQGSNKIIKYLDDDGIKLLYSRLNRRYRLVDALPDISHLSASGKKPIYILRSLVDGALRYCPFIVDNNEWHNIGSDEATLAIKADKVTGATAGNVATLDASGNLSDGGMMPGVFTAMTYDSLAYGRATDLRDIWAACLSGMPVQLLDNKTTGNIASLNEIGYIWVDSMSLKTRSMQGSGHQIKDDTVHGYYSYITDTFYEDEECTRPISGSLDKLYLNISNREGSGKVYRYTGTGYSMVQRYVQFMSGKVVTGNDPVWENSKESKTIFFRMVEPLSGFSPDSFTSIEIENSGSAKVEHCAATVAELRELLDDKELGWCTGDNQLYIKIGQTVRPVADGGGGGGGTPVEVRGTAGQVVVTNTTEAGVNIYTVSLAESIVESQVPAPMEGDNGKVLTADGEGNFEWVEPVVETVTKITL